MTTDLDALVKLAKEAMERAEKTRYDSCPPWRKWRQITDSADDVPALARAVVELSENLRETERCLAIEEQQASDRLDDWYAAEKDRDHWRSKAEELSENLRVAKGTIDGYRKSMTSLAECRDHWKARAETAESKLREIGDEHG